jgi:uncharacterized membrane protein
MGGSVRTNDRVRAGEERGRRTLSFVLVLVDLSVFVLTIANQHGTVRFVLGLAFSLVVPGWSVVGLLKLRNVPLEIGLTVASSLALLMTAAQVLMTIHVWRLAGLEMVFCLACLPSLMRQSRVRHPRRRDSV